LGKGKIVSLILIATLWIAPVQAYDLRSLIDSITGAAKNIVQGLVFLSFIVGLGLYVLPLPWEEWSARGKALMVRACMAQVVYALATLIFQWLGTFGGF